ncbi:hypothetical protein AFX72_02755 [Listeria monocytogenes]|nr:hypothetical protein AFX74_01750 [Listeria monocytogenes]RKA69336.1 hypothetical protein AFX68_02881 [Listeria monocytogenes]RKB24344.1 hypothetical protein AFX72_02755 [Listeria monocytogenes]RKB24820.1 hypothetical protein AFX62_02468 [Listeria monocytogenes]RKB65338.1 hypothetical protein HL29_01252 [Listeria monocytogenes]
MNFLIILLFFKMIDLMSSISRTKKETDAPTSASLVLTNHLILYGIMLMLMLIKVIIA